MYTKRQVWKTMRKLVSSNNAELRRIYSSDVGFIMKEKYRNSPSLSKEMAIEKQYLINSGVKNIFRSIVDNFFSYDKEAKERYFEISQSGENWQDLLSTKDLFFLYRFQNNILEGFYNSKIALNESLVTKIINEAQVDDQFKLRSIIFSGKPEKIFEDKNKIDIESEQVRREVISSLEEEIFGVKKESFVEKSNEEINKNEKFEGEQTGFGKFIGLDIQGSPIYENNEGQIIDCYCNVYNGQIFGLDNDELVEIGNSEDGVIGPVFKFDEDLNQ